MLHEGDSVSIRRLCAEGLQVLERARPRTQPASLHVNYGGVAIAAAPGLRMSAVMLAGGQQVQSLEYLCARLDVGGSACTVLLVYRPASVAVGPSFFVELSDVLDQLVSRCEPVIVAGDFSIRLDRPDDHQSRRQLLDVLSAHGLQCRVTSPTHDRGGILDIVATCDDLVAPDVSMFEVGICDHRLL